jgi:hypothetical protein
MAVKDVSAGSTYPGIEALARARTDLATAAQSCRNAIRAISPPGEEGPPRIAGLAFLAGMMTGSLAGLEYAREGLARIQVGVIKEYVGSDARCLRDQ